MFRFVLIAALVPLGITANIPYKILTDEGIVGGEATTIEEYPYQLALERQNPLKFLCGASLIRPTVALTAAHCTKGMLLQVRAGSADRLNGGMVVKVVSTYDHPKYNLEILFDYDVSVLILESPLLNSRTVQTIALQPAGVEVADDTLATVTGWGDLLEGSNNGSNVLQKVMLRKVNFKKCAAAYKDFPLSKRMECYGYPGGGKGTCQGDSGGPIVANGKQVGIVSFGAGCARAAYPTVYAKISNKEISDYINKYI